MRCDKATRMLQFYIDRQLTLKQTRLLEAHIADCHACREEVHLLEEVACGLNTLKFVAEPTNMHEQIMQKVALNSLRQQQQRHRQRQRVRYSLFRPSLLEILAAVLLATVATISILLQQPSLHALLPVANGHDILSRMYTQIIHALTSIDTNTLTMSLWVVGTLLGVCITLIVAGSDMRTQWFKAVMERLPVR